MTYRIILTLWINGISGMGLPRAAGQDWFDKRSQGRFFAKQVRQMAESLPFIKPAKSSTREYLIKAGE
jgi:hypothetical protein